MMIGYSITKDNKSISLTTLHPSSFMNGKKKESNFIK